jgi:RNA polymerase sigma-70 factor (family 1)
MTHEAFRALFDKYWDLLCRLAVAKTGDQQDAEDLVQELFIDLWHKKQPLTLTTSIRTYLISCLYLKLFKYFRKKGFHQKHYEDFNRYVQAIATTGSTALAGMEFEQEYGKLQDIIAQCVAVMPRQMKTVFSLKHYEGYSTQEIAEKLQVSPETVKTHLKHAMLHLRKVGREYPTGALLLPVFLQMLERSGEFILS